MKTKQELIEAIAEGTHAAKITFEEAQANYQRAMNEVETMQSELDAMERDEANAKGDEEQAI